MPTFIVKDTVMYERTWRVEAADAEAALELVMNECPTPEHEEQIDNTPYEVTPEEMDDCEKCGRPIVPPSDARTGTAGGHGEPSYEAKFCRHCAPTPEEQEGAYWADQYRRSSRV